MTPLTINVSGQSSISRHPERGVLQVSVKADGHDKETVSKEVTLTSNELHQLFKELSPKDVFGILTADAPVTIFSSTMLRTWSQASTDKDGNPLPRVHYATSSYQVFFRDFAKLSEVVGKLVTYPNVEIQSIDWRLTDSTQKALGCESRQLAMRDAIQKANDFAEVIGRKVVPVEINDGGQGSFNQTHQMPMVKSRLFGSAAPASIPDASNALDLTPQDIRFTGSVDVKFEAVSD